MIAWLIWYVEWTFIVHMVGSVLLGILKALFGE